MIKCPMSQGYDCLEIFSIQEKNNAQRSIAAKLKLISKVKIPKIHFCSDYMFS